MSKCDNCRLRKESAQAFDIHWLGEEDCPYDVCPEIKTNGGRIRAMSDEEMALYLRRTCDCNSDCVAMTDGCCRSGISCQKAWLDWPKQEAKQ